MLIDVTAGDIIIDQYSPLSHKLPLRPNDSTLAPTWVNDDHRRRLDAYKIRAAYRENVARLLLNDGNGDTDRREYGDAELIIQRAMAGVLGDSIELIVDGADDNLPDEPDLPDLPERPDELPADADELTQAQAAIRKRVFDANVAAWKADAEAALTRWEQDRAAQPALRARQDWLRQWFEDEFMHGKIVEAEGDSIGLGDGVYELAWSPATGRPRVTVYDPGCYFPVLTDRTTGYPTKVHLAWEVEEDDDTARGRKFVRRLTWELVDTLAARPLNDDDTITLHEGERLTEHGLERIYPWNKEPSTVTCLFTDATWELNQAQSGNKADDFDPDKATYAMTEDGFEARELDLEIDFIPLVHVPNTPATREHFGRSIIDLVAQILDELSATDSDIAAATALAAGPMVYLAGGTMGGATTDPKTGAALDVPQVTVRPGTAVSGPENGRMDVLDLSAGLTAVTGAGDRILDRLSVNSRIPAEVLGRVDDGASDLSGVAIAMRFGPFRQLVELLRLTRHPKYMLLLKFVQRLAQAGGVLEAGENPTARIVFGSYLPSDLAEVVELVVKLLEQHGTSRHTALRLLVDAGVDVGDLVEELDRINAEDTAAAVQVAEATASEQLAAERLGLELPAEPVVAAPTVTINQPGTDQGGE